MNIISTSVFVGPNTFARTPLIRLTVDIDPHYAEKLNKLGIAVYQALEQVVPGISSETVDQDPGMLIARLALKLQHLAGMEGGTAFTAPSQDVDEAEVLYSYETENIGLEAGEVACDMLVALARSEDDLSTVDLSNHISRYLRYADKRTLGPSAMELVKAAQERDIPWYRMNDASLIQVGQGNIRSALKRR